MSFICTIDTSRYRNRRCSQKNWEPGTVNDQMHAMHGWSHTEPDVQSLRWRLMMFQGITPYSAEEYASEAYQSWKAQPCNKLSYWDKLCEMERVTDICPPGFKQGAALRLDSLIQVIQTDGSVEIPFSRVYDSRQYDKHMNGCVLRIVFVPEDQ